MQSCYLVVGLGNPGREYARTRHNAGYMAVALLGERWGAAWRSEKRFRSRLARLARGADRVLLCQPETFMNASGEAVAAVAGYYQVPWERLLVTVDDADLELGTIRLRPGGSAGGHHGLESIERHLGTRQFARLRVGIGRARAGDREITDHVLSRFGQGEVELLEKVLARACDQIECWWQEGIGPAMNRFNGVMTDNKGN